jgi:hypothetical protein
MQKSNSKSINRALLLRYYSFINLEKHNSLRRKGGGATRRVKELSSIRNFPSSSGKATSSARQGYCYALL